MLFFLLVVGENIRNPTQQNLEGDRGSVRKFWCEAARAKNLKMAQNLVVHFLETTKW